MSGLGADDYVVPTCTTNRRVEGGQLPKDTGEFSSRIGQIKAAATKVPGPGKYVGHDTWKAGGNKFSNTAREAQ